MTPPPAELPDDIEALRRLATQQAAALAAAQDELAAARAGLAAKVLEIEKLKVQIARLRKIGSAAGVKPE